MTLPKELAHLKIPLEDIQSATDNFADENLIREGGFGRIYRGKLTRSGKTVDIVARRLDYTCGQGIKEFWTEILMLYSLKNQKLVSLVWFCEENNEKIIVNKHEANGSLDQYLRDPAFTWTRRLQVCLDVARALSYIHYDKHRNFSVIHGNLKSSKILLDEKWEAKISGFELSKINPVARRHGLVLDRNISGTYAYVDPAYVKSGGVTHKSDVYSLGVILFELMCGKKAFVPDWDDGPSPRLAKPHSNEGILDDVKGDGKPSSFDTFRPPSFNTYGASYTFQPPSFNTSGASYTFQPPSFNDIKELMVAPSFVDHRYSSSFVDRYPSSFPEEEYCDNDRYAALCMATTRDLKHLKVPKEGLLLSELAKSHYETRNLDNIIHPGLRVQMESQSLKIFSEAAYCCLKEKRAERPNIDRIISALKKALERQ